MKISLRWQLLLALSAFALVLSLLSFQTKAGGLCSVQVPAAGGTFAEGIVGSPQRLNPLLSDAYPVDREIASLLFDGLTKLDDNGRFVPALAHDWIVSEDGMTVRFNLRQDVNWHDGQPFSANDVAFTYGLLQDDTFAAPAALRNLWQAVTITLVDDATIEFTLPEPYAPFLEATTRGILPAHLLADAAPADLADHPFNLAPTGTGPFMIASGQDWQRSHRLRLIPNPVDWRQGWQITALEFDFYPDEAMLVEAFANGDIQAINSVSQEALPQLAAMDHARLFTSGIQRTSTVLFNLSETGANAVRTVEVRRALAYALDREMIVDEVLNGQGLVVDGPYLPTSWAYNPNLLTAYSYQPITSTVLLEDSGWLLPEGSAVRQQEEESLSLRLLSLDTPMYRALAQQIAGYWTAVGIEVNTTFAAGEALHTALAERSFDAALVELRPTNDPDLYDFWSQEAIVRGQNYAGWNQRRASEALERGRKPWTPEERRPSYDNFQSQYDSRLPALTLFQHTATYALSSAVNQAEIGLINNPRDRYATMANWFLLYRDVTVNCPPESA